jgi:hypothetical protein
METALYIGKEAELAAGKVRRSAEENGKNLDWFKSLDLNGNGVIDPNEITPNFNNEE